jgi:hypothetical protein
MVVIFHIVAVNAFAQEQAPAPVFEDGDFWHFKSTERSHQGASRSNPVDGVYGLSYSQGKLRISKLTDGQKEPAERTAIRTFFALFGQRPDVKDLQFPLFVGEKWSYKYELTAIGAKRSLNRDVEIKVTGIEQVSTPAGNFRAFKLEKEDAAGHEHESWVTTYFYSPETKSVVKSFFDARGGATLTIDIQLIKFGSAQKHE